MNSQECELSFTVVSAGVKKSCYVRPRCVHPPPLGNSTLMFRLLSGLMGVGKWADHSCKTGTCWAWALALGTGSAMGHE